MKLKRIKLILLFRLIQIYASTETNAREKNWRCDYTYNQDCDCFIKFHEVPNTWHEAQLRCHYEGAVIASPTVDMIDTMKNIVQLSRVASQKIFIGIHAIYSPGHFFSVEGMTITDIPRKWAEGKPNETRVENCLTMNAYGTLVDVACNEMYPFICSKRYDGKELNNCGTTDSHYTFNESTGNCYKFHIFPHSWERAYLICGAEGGYLTVINSESEAHSVRSLLKNTLTHDHTKNNNEDSAFIGFRDWHDQGTWITVHSQSLSEAGYEKFEKGEPNTDVEDDTKLCGTIEQSGHLGTATCNSILYFICEKDPTTYC